MKYGFCIYFSILPALCCNCKMLKSIILLVLIFAFCQSVSGRQKPVDHYIGAGFADVMVKKRVKGRICDTCKVDFAVDAENDFSYLITGSERTPKRLHLLYSKIKDAHKGKQNSAVHLISKRTIAITFLPNFLMEKGKRVQYFRSYGGADYRKLEFSAQQNGKIIKSWFPLLGLGEDKDYAVIGMPGFYAGTYNLDINDSLDITIRDISTKKVVKTITIIRAEDKAHHFLFYQLPMGSEHFSANLQNILNLSSGIPKIEQGMTSNIFKKDYGTIGMLRFSELDNDELQYAFEKEPAQWKSMKGLNAENSAYIVLGNEMPEGKTQSIYLRYSSQPETIHRITIVVQRRPFQIPWGKAAMISLLLLTTGGLWFYLRNKRIKKKLAALKRKSDDAEVKLSLLSGQLNPHFLFNSLTAIQGSINSSNPDRANAYIGNVAGFMRDVMDNGKKEFVSLQEELKLEADYLKLEQERSRFNYVITIAPELDTSQIDFPPLLLQPVLENSIRHAFNRELNHPMINIKILSRDNTLYLEVSDNGNLSWDSAGMHEGYGLSLTRKRIAVYNEKLESMCIQMQINYQPGIGTMTTFTFQNWLA